MSLLLSVSPGDSLGARPGLPYGLSDDESGGGRALSAESEVEEPARGPGEARGERPGPACQLCGGPTGEGPCCGAGGPGGGPPLPPRLLYSCRLCAFVSHYSSHLKRHMQTHSGEKPFRCVCACVPVCVCACAGVYVCQCTRVPVHACASVVVCTHARVHMHDSRLHGGQCLELSQGFGLPTCTQGPLTASLPGPPAQSASLSWRGFRYCSPASSSIRILLHSCESFSKQTVRGREGRAAKGRGSLQTEEEAGLP